MKRLLLLLLLTACHPKTTPTVMHLTPNPEVQGLEIGRIDNRLYLVMPYLRDLPAALKAAGCGRTYVCVQEASKVIVVVTIERK